MKTKYMAIAAAILFGLLAACASLLGPHDFEIPLAKLQQGLDKKFPFNNRYLELLDIDISHPLITLEPAGNRIVIAADAVVAPFFLKKEWKGKLVFSGTLQFDGTRNAIVLAEPRVETFAVDGIDPSYNAKIAKIGRLLAEQILKQTPLYTFKPDQLQYGGASFTLSKIATKADAIVVTFEPVR